MGSSGSELPLQLVNDSPSTGEVDSATLAAIATRIYDCRILRDRKFGSNGLFGEPAWDILLSLYSDQVSGRPVSVSSACIAANVPETTALRWLGKLEKEGLIERNTDPADRRRVYVSLTRIGRAKLESTLIVYAD